ncbi:hypothetical protein [Nostoc sp. C117]
MGTKLNGSNLSHCNFNGAISRIHNYVVLT